MTSRTKQITVHFSKPFKLPGFDELQASGGYRVDHDEELVEGISRLAWRRVASFIHLPAIASQSSTRQMVPTTPMDLEAALERDAQKQ